MFVYLSVMFLCCIFLYAMRNNSNKILPLTITFGIIWLMIALQEGWGGDYGSYVYYFDIYKGESFHDLMSDDSHGALGYKVFLSIMPTVHFAMVIAMAIWCCAFAFLFYHFIPQKWWFLAIIFVFIDRAIMMGAISSFPRMAIAQSFLVFAFYTQIKGKKWWLFVLLLLCGSVFHKSVLIMLPMVFISPSKSKIKPFTIIGTIALLAVFMMLSPSSWINFVEGIIVGSDQFNEYAFYLEGQEATRIKGLSLILLFYWIYLLAQQVTISNFTPVEYLVLKLALVRIVFDLLPAVGMSVRFFYYIDIYFIAGMMVLFYRLPKNDANKWFLFFSLMLIFWYFGYHVYASAAFFWEHWGTYNLIF